MRRVEGRLIGRSTNAGEVRHQTKACGEESPVMGCGIGDCYRGIG